jgi:MFS transporter, DHA1 family, inner membrane transport protein
VTGQAALFAVTRLVMNTSGRMVYPFLPFFARGLGVGLDGLSYALMARQLMGMLTPLFSPLADRRGRRFGMLAGVLVFILSMVVVSIWPNYLTFISALSFSLLGMYLMVSSVQAYIGDEVAYDRRGLVIAITELGWSVSFLIGVPLMGLAIARYGWQAPFPLLAILGGICFLLILWIVPRGKRSSGGTANNLWDGLRSVAASPVAISGLGMGVALTAANESVNLVFGVWLEDNFQLKIAALSGVAIVIGLAELCGELFTAGLTDRLGKARAVRIGLVLNCVCAVLLPLCRNSFPLTLAGLVGFYLSFEFSIVSSLPIITEIMPQARATLMGVNVSAFSLGRAIGALLAPLLYTWSFSANGWAAVVFNLIAFGCLARIHLPGISEQEEAIQ